MHNSLAFNEVDVQREAQSILEATSVRLWEDAERKGLKFKVVPFPSNKPIYLPGVAPRFNFPKETEET